MNSIDVKRVVTGGDEIFSKMGGRGVKVHLRV